MNQGLWNIKGLNINKHKQPPLRRFRTFQWGRGMFFGCILSLVRSVRWYTWRVQSAEWRMSLVAQQAQHIQQMSTMMTGTTG
jgi:hypothetical protein